MRTGNFLATLTLGWIFCVETCTGTSLGLLSLLEATGWDLFTEVLLRMSSFLLGYLE